MRQLGTSLRRPTALVDLPALLPVVLMFGTALFLAVHQGGSDTNAWYEAGLFALALLAVSVLATRGHVRVARALAPVLGAFTLYTIWCYASLLWSDAKGAAWDGANRTLLYLVVLAFFALVPMARSGAVFLLAAYGTAVAAVGSYVFATTTTGPNSLRSFIGGRLADPIGYPNGNAALFMLGFWCVLPIAASNRLPLLLRLVGVGAACVNLDLFLLPESRGGIGAAVISALVFLVVARDRVRAVGALFVVGACSGLAAPALFRVYRIATNGGPLGSTLRSARHAILLSGLGAVLATAILFGLARVVRGRRVERIAARTATPALNAVLLIAIAALLVFALADRKHLANQAEVRSDQFTSTPSSTQPIRPTDTHFASDLGGGARYDMWRVSWHEFRAHPVEGVGVDNFAADYLRLRRSDEEPVYPHSAVMRLFSETGIVGTLLFGAFVVLLGWKLVRANSRAASPLIPAAIALFVYWFVHSSVDWLWEIPAVTLPMFLVVGVALTMSSDSPDPPASLPFPAGRPIVAAVSLVGAVSLLLPWLAARQETVALQTWRVKPAAAAHALSAARGLNPLSDQPDLIAGAIAARRHDYPEMRASFANALRRNPADWYAHLELGALAAIERSNRLAATELATAHRLNPREQAVGVAQTGLRTGHPVALAALDEIFVQRVRARNTPGIQDSRP